MLRPGDPYVFISHSSHDNDAAHELVAELEGHGVNVWIDMVDIVPGKPYPVQIEQAIKGCAAFVILLSSNANGSTFVRSETEMAYSRVPIFPVRIEEVTPGEGLGLFLNVQHWTNAFGPRRAQAVERLAQAINHEIGAGADEPLPTPIRPAAAQPTPAPTPAPMPASMPSSGAAQPATRMGLMGEAAGLHDPDSRQPLDNETAVRAFIGEKAPHFIEAWRRKDLTGSSTFNWFAFFFGPFWFAWRRMHKWAWGMMGLWALLMCFQLIGEANQEAGSVILVGLLWIAQAVAVGLNANGIYREHTGRQVALHNQGYDPQRVVRDRLSMLGGTSGGALTGMLVAWFFVAIFFSAIGTAIAEQNQYLAQQAAAEAAGDAAAGAEEASRPGGY